MKWKRAMSGLLAAVMMVGVVPAAAASGDAGDAEPMTQEKVNAANRGLQ